MAFVLLSQVGPQTAGQLPPKKRISGLVMPLTQPVRIDGFENRPPRIGKQVIIIFCVHMAGQTVMPQVIPADDIPRRLLGLSKRGNNNGKKQGDNGNHYQ